MGTTYIILQFAGASMALILFTCNYIALWDIIIMIINKIHALLKLTNKNWNFTLLSKRFHSRTLYSQYVSTLPARGLVVGNETSAPYDMRSGNETLHVPVYMVCVIWKIPVWFKVWCCHNYTECLVSMLMDLDPLLCGDLVPHWIYLHCMKKVSSIKFMHKTLKIGFTM